MILADKIIDLRKKNGWSQEELADRLGVSRQSVSKWEGAQSMPDMNKILKMSEVFGVSTDYLLKEEIDAPEVMEEIPVEVDVPAIRVSMEEAVSFLEFKNMAAARISLGVLLCILSPVLLIILGGLEETGRLPLSEMQVGGFGVSVLLVLVGIAVALFVMTGLQGSRYEYFEKEAIDTEYGVDGMVRDRREKFRPAYTKQLTVGIVLCVLAVVPLFLAMMIFNSDSDFYYVLSMALMLAIVAFGVLLIVRSSILWGGMQMLLEEGDYTRRAKEEEKRNDPLATVYWCVVIAAYLGYSFITGNWHRSWIIWPVAGVFYGAVEGIMRIVRHRA